MQLRHFVLVCSVALLGWLAVAFVHEVPSNRYLESLATKTAAAPVTAPAGLAAPDELAVSVSP